MANLGISSSIPREEIGLQLVCGQFWFLTCVYFSVLKEYWQKEMAPVQKHQSFVSCSFTSSRYCKQDLNSFWQIVVSLVFYQTKERSNTELELTLILGDVLSTYLILKLRFIPEPSLCSAANVTFVTNLVASWNVLSNLLRIFLR